MAATDGMVAGFYRLQLCFRTSTGYPMGTQTDPDNTASGTTTSPYLVPGPVQITPATVTRMRATRQGGMKVLGSRFLGISDLGEFGLTLSGDDEVFDAYIKRYTVDSATFTGLDITAPNVREGDPPQMMAICSLGFMTNAGVNQYKTWILHNVQIVRASEGPSGAQDDGVNPQPHQYTMTVSSSTRTGIGLLYSATALAVEDNDDIAIAIRHTSPISLTTYKAASGGTSFITGFRPVSSDATNVTNAHSIDGVKTNPTSVSTTTGVVVIPSATVDNIYVMAYPTDFVAI